MKYGCLTRQHSAALLPLHTPNDDFFLSQMNNVDASITQVVYSYQRGNKISATYWVSVKKNGDAFATGKTVSADPDTR